MAVFNIQNHFNTGWVSPAWAARADSQERFNGLLRADNLAFPPQGGCHKRPVLRVLAKATGVERIFRWHRNEREKFVVGVDGDGKPYVYNTEFGSPDADSPAIDGSLSFNNADRLNAFPPRRYPDYHRWGELPAGDCLTGQGGADCRQSGADNQGEGDYAEINPRHIPAGWREIRRRPIHIFGRFLETFHWHREPNSADDPDCWPPEQRIDLLQWHIHP